MNVLHLYHKAQTQTLDAQELAWIDHETREHPYFGLAYMISARHHLSEKTTVKDRALLLGATYALDRSLLHAYVSDTLGSPKHSKTTSLVEVAAPAPEPEKLEEKAPEQEIVVVESVEAPVAEAVEAVETAESTEEIVAAESSISEAAQPEILQAPVLEAVKQEVETPLPVIGINWFLNMRIKLRASKLKVMSEKIRASVAVYAAQAAASPAAEPVQRSAAPETASTVAPKTDTAQKSSRKQPLSKPESGEAPQSEYAIGAFSSFTFLQEQESDLPDANETEVEALVMESESIAVEASIPADLPGEIIFEEGNRVVEIVVSPELRERFFKGRLPIELNFGSAEQEPDPKAKAEKPAAKFRENKPKEQAAEAPATPPIQQRRKKASELIDRFIELEPSIPKGGEGEPPSGDLSKSSSQDSDEWVTETLARIYAQQGNRSKAIKIYQKLGLLFPEKKDYFATRIAELK